MGFAPSLLVAVVGTMVALPSAMAGFDANANDNIAIYWGKWKEARVADLIP
jgi:hypothetical protein